MGLYVKLKNCFAEELSHLNSKIEELENIDLPSFVTQRPYLDEDIKKCENLKKYDNVLLIGNGGSVNGAKAFYGALPSKKKFEFITTMEPDFLNNISARYSKDNTLVLAVSKSGTTVGVIEALMFFLNRDFKAAVITSQEGTLYEIAKKKGLDIMVHPPVGGRFASGTICGLAPALLMGADLDLLENGFKNAFEKYSPKTNLNENLGKYLSCILYILENKGKHDVFMPVYSYRMSHFLPIIIQLMHESFGKNNLGQSFFGDLAPESQHHTNQRFFGGRKNICALFIHVLSQDDSSEKISIPDELKNIIFKGSNLDLLQGVPYEKSLEFEYTGTFEDAVNKKFPVIDLSVDKVNEKSLGEMMGFWQYVAVYSSVLRGVNPYDQPQVEDSKKISFQKRKDFKSQ